MVAPKETVADDSPVCTYAEVCISENKGDYGYVQTGRTRTSSSASHDSRPGVGPFKSHRWTNVQSSVVVRVLCLRTQQLFYLSYS